MSELANEFVHKKGTDVHLILYGKSREIFYSIPDSISIHKPEWEFDNKKRLLSTLETILYLRKTIKKIQPDSVLSFGELWNNLVLLSLLGLKFPVYISDRCQPDKKFSRFQEITRKWLYPKATGIIAQTAIAKKLYTQFFSHSNIQVIGNPIREIPNYQSESKKENIVLSVGRVIETKHHDRLIKIFRNAALPDWKLVIVGGNALKQDGLGRLNRLIIDLELEEKVLLTGNVSDVEKYYNKSKIFAFTSSSEGFPNVIGEAMSAGLPVISYDCTAGPGDLIDDGETGFLIPLFNDTLYEKKLLQLMKNEKLRKRLGNASRRKINEFSVKSIGDQFYSFITAGL